MTPSLPAHGPYVSAQGRARVTTVLLIAGAVISGLLIVAEIIQLAFPEFSEGQQVSDNAGGLLGLVLYSLLTILGALVFVATVIVFLMWLHRVSSNLPAFGYWRSQGYSPAWAIGSFFVPFVNLAVPYQAIKDIWQKSRPASSEPFSFSHSPPGFFPAWWGFWLASNFATNAHFRMSGNPGFRDAALIAGIISEMLSIPAAVFAIQVVRDIVKRQEQAIAHMRPNEQFPVPPPPPTFEQAGEKV